MKNSIYINIDTDRTPPIVFGVTPDMIPPQNEEEAKALVLKDIKCLTDALLTLINLAHKNNFGDSTVLINESITILSNSLTDEHKEEIKGSTTE